MSDSEYVGTAHEAEVAQFIANFKKEDVIDPEFRRIEDVEFVYDVVIKLASGEDLSIERIRLETKALREMDPRRTYQISIEEEHFSEVQALFADLNNFVILKKPLP